MKTITIKTSKQLKELVLNDKFRKGSRSSILSNLRYEFKLLGEPVCIRTFFINGHYVRCKLDADFEKDLKKLLGV